MLREDVYEEFFRSESKKYPRFLQVNKFTVYIAAAPVLMFVGPYLLIALLSSLISPIFAIALAGLTIGLTWLCGRILYTMVDTGEWSTWSVIVVILMGLIFINNLISMSPYGLIMDLFVAWAVISVINTRKIHDNANRRYFDYCQEDKYRAKQGILNEPIVVYDETPKTAEEEIRQFERETASVSPFKPVNASTALPGGMSSSDSRFAPPTSNPVDYAPAATAATTAATASVSNSSYESSSTSPFAPATSSSSMKTGSLWSSEDVDSPVWAKSNPLKTLTKSDDDVRQSAFPKRNEFKFCPTCGFSLMPGEIECGRCATDPKIHPERFTEDDSEKIS